MSEYQESNNFELSKLLLLLTPPKKFKNQFQKFRKNSIRKMYHALSIKIIRSIVRGSIKEFEKWLKLIESIKNITDEFNEHFRSSIDKSLADSNLIILACKYSQANILEYVLHNPKVLNLFDSDSESLMKPDDVDDNNHNAFYYAIRSGDGKLIELLVKEWPHNYCLVSTEVFSDLLSRSYEEIQLKNIALSYEMKIQVEKMIIDYRFYADATKSKSKVSHQDINRRIDLVVDNIKVILRDYSSRNLDDKFFYIVRFIVQNIHNLKRLLKSTYIKLPWEEIEFCTIAFISTEVKSRTNRKIICNYFLTKNKLFYFLEKFSDTLEIEKRNINNSSIQELAVLPCISREKAIALIEKNDPEFKELYNEYRNMRDTHSLEIVHEYLNLASSVNPRDHENQLIIIRAIQIMGEFFKNTLESPKMSSTISDILLSALRQNTQKLIIGLRNSLSHSFSLSQRLELEERSNDVFFSNVQQDIKVMNRVVVNMLYKTRFQHLKRILKNIIACETIDQMRNVLETFDFDLENWKASNEQSEDNQELIECFEELNSLMPENNTAGKNLINNVKKLITTEFVNNENKLDYVLIMMAISRIRKFMYTTSMHADSLRLLKIKFQKTLLNIDFELNVRKMKTIEKACHYMIMAIEPETPFIAIRMNGLISRIMYQLGYDPRTMRWIQEFRDKLEKNTDVSREFNYNQSHKTGNKIEILNQSYTFKASALNSLVNRIDFLEYKNSKKLQVIVEMLVLDVLSILNDSSVHMLADNQLFLDFYSPILIGKNLRNHLAHHNDIIKIISYDSTIAAFLNAQKLVAENILDGHQKIGKVTNNNLDKLLTKYEQDLEIIGNQEEMFRALEEGDLKKLKETVKKGADIHGKNVRSWSALHFAAKGPDFDAAKFIISKNVDLEVINDCGQNALHIAAQYGRKEISEFLIEKGFDVNAKDNSGQTALHKAAESGHVEIVKLLIKNRAETEVKNKQGDSPLYTAVMANHKNVVEILFQYQRSIALNKLIGEVTALHCASYYGHVEIVEYLINNNGNVNAKTHANDVPLLGAAINGHLEVVKILISHGADIHAANIKGLTALHNAVETNREEVAEILLQHGADVNFSPANDKFSPINYAAQKGFVSMLKLLLKYNARVNISTSEGETPLHYAAFHGHVDVIDILIENKAIINAMNNKKQTPLDYAAAAGHENVVECLLKKGASPRISDCNKVTPLHMAAYSGNPKCIDVLLKYNADIEAKDRDGQTALHLTSHNGHVAATQLLISKGADINAKNSNGITPLHAASTANEIEIVKMLVNAGANINLRNGYNTSVLEWSILEGHTEIVKYFIDNKLPFDREKINSELIITALRSFNQEIVKIIIENSLIKVEGEQSTELLSCAIRYNHVKIIELLLKLGVPVDHDALTFAVSAGYKNIIYILFNHGSININNYLKEDITLLHAAINYDHTSIVEIFIKKGANVNAFSSEGLSSLHVAASKGSSDIIKLLLDNGADPSLKDNKNRTALELTLIENSEKYIKCFKILFEFRDIDINYKCNNEENWTLLHLAAQDGNVPITEYLVEKGADINFKSRLGSKPIHIAASRGHECLVEYYLGKNINIDDRSENGWSLLHHAVSGNQTNMINYLINKKFDVNVTDLLNNTPLDWALIIGFEGVVKTLLNNGAPYDGIDKCNRKSVKWAMNSDINKVFDCIDRLFGAVKRNDIAETRHCINNNVLINAVNSEHATALHYAAWKSHIEITELLLSGGANPNIGNKNGSTPLHYAAKFGCRKMVQILLNNGAIYNAKTNKNNTPSKLATNLEIIELLELIDQSFVSIESGSTKVINDLKNVSIDILKTVMNARNKKGKTLIVIATLKNFKNVDALKDIGCNNCKNLNIDKLLLDGNYQEALNVCYEIFQRRVKYLSYDDPGIIEIEFKKAFIIYKQQNYQKALDLLTQIHSKQRKIFGADFRDTLKTNSVIAMTLHRLDRKEEALELFEETYEKQKKILEVDDDSLINLQIEMGLILIEMKKYEESLFCYREVLEKRSNCLDLLTFVGTQSCIAMVYTFQGKFVEAMDQYQKVLNMKTEFLGPKNYYTLRTVFDKNEVLIKQNKLIDALENLSRLLIVQTEALGSNHIDVWKTKLRIGDVYFLQDEPIKAIKFFTSIQKPITQNLGNNHPEVKMLRTKIDKIIKFHSRFDSNIMKYFQNTEEIKEAAKSVKSIKDLLISGVDINFKDSGDLTLLHYAVNNQDESIVKFLLKNNANCCSLSNKGNTALHTAVTKNNKIIVCILLEHAKGVLKNSEFNKFINSKTHSRGMTCLHVAAQKGFEDIVEVLLRNGAIFNCTNTGNETPYDLCDNDNINRLLKLIHEAFEDTRRGSEMVITKLKRCDDSKNVVILNSRNVQSQTLINLALANNHKYLAHKFLEILKNIN